MPTRRVLPSPSLRESDEEVSLLVEEVVEELADASLDWAAGPHAVRTVIPPTVSAVMPEALRKSRRENEPDACWMGCFFMMVLPGRSPLFPFRATQPEGTHSPPPCKRDAPTRPDARKLRAHGNDTPLAATCPDGHSEVTMGGVNPVGLNLIFDITNETPVPGGRQLLSSRMRQRDCPFVSKGKLPLSHQLGGTGASVVDQVPRGALGSASSVSGAKLRAR